MGRHVIRHWAKDGFLRLQPSFAVEAQPHNHNGVGDCGCLCSIDLYTFHKMIVTPSRTALRHLRAQSRFIRPGGASAAGPHFASFARLLSSLAVLEQRDGKLNVSSLAAVSAAQKLGGSVTGLVAGKGAKVIADEAAKVKGVDKIIYVDNDAYDRVRWAMHCGHSLLLLCS
jgi:hypothetical protein